ncbi:MAG: GntG family PLP-dependent aldolase [Thermomicrobiales bacterium]
MSETTTSTPGTGTGNQVAAPDLSGVIDLRSDTVTRPTPSMRRAMAEAIVGDDQYGDDPTVNELEAQAAELMGKEAAVFVPSGTMGNLASLLSRCDRGMEAIVGSQSHILWYEMSGASALGGIPLFTVENDRWGQLDLDQVEMAIRVNGPTSPVTGVICVENTHNRCGGTVLSMDYLKQLREISLRRGVPIHMDGARIFNASAALGVPVSEIAAEVDSVQFCLSKGLAAPVGTLVTGDAAFVQKVRRARKILGGAMRQSGVVAAAGLVAFEEMIGRLPQDHARARHLAEMIAAIPGVTIDIETTQTNIVVFRPQAGLDKAAVIAAFRERGLWVSDYGTRGIRLVTHYEIDDAAIARAEEIITSVLVPTGATHA